MTKRMPQDHPRHEAPSAQPAAPVKNALSPSELAFNRWMEQVAEEEVSRAVVKPAKSDR